MEAVLFVGLQGSGKSTFYKEYFYRTHIRINLDMLKTRRREMILMEACIAARQSFVIDNTNPTIEARKKYMDVLKSKGIKIIGYFFDCTVEDALLRNKNRDKKEQVPPAAIYSTYRRLHIPSYEEGFDKLYHVKTISANRFEVYD